MAAVRDRMKKAHCRFTSCNILKKQKQKCLFIQYTVKIQKGIFIASTDTGKFSFREEKKIEHTKQEPT